MKEFTAHFPGWEDYPAGIEEVDLIDIYLEVGKGEEWKPVHHRYVMSRPGSSL